jgi:hypothetical protein
MTTLLQKAFTEIQKLPEFLQDELAQQLLEDIGSELEKPFQRGSGIGSFNNNGTGSSDRRTRGENRR